MLGCSQYKEEPGRSNLIFMGLAETGSKAVTCHGARGEDPVSFMGPHLALCIGEEGGG